MSCQRDTACVCCRTQIATGRPAAAAVDRYLLPVWRSAANPPQRRARMMGRTDRRTDGRTDGHTDALQFHRPCSAYCASSVNNTKKVHETITFLLVTLPNIYRFRKKFTDRLINKPFLIWLLTTPPHLKYVVTLSYNLSLMSCFADINVSQGSI